MYNFFRFLFSVFLKESDINLYISNSKVFYDIFCVVLIEDIDYLVIFY